MITKRLLIIGFVWPEPNSSAAGSRMLQLIDQFQQQDFDITFVSAAKTSKNTFDLYTLGVSSDQIKLNDSSFDDFILKLNPHAVLFDRFMTEEQYGWCVVEQCPNAIRILDTEDFHGLRKGREMALKQNENFSIEYLQNDTTKREIASMYRCDLSLIISEAEIELFSNEFKIDKDVLHYLPFLLEPINDSEIGQLPAFEEREHFVAIGNFLHLPNYDAILYLKTSIWPRIKKKLPKAELHIYGAYESQKVSQLHNESDGFLIKGFVEDANVVMQNAKVCLAPLRFGAGLKGKLIDAMQNGTPCVMSSIAAEGMFGDLSPNGFIEDDSDTFANNAVELYLNESLWNEKATNGFNVLNSRFDKKLFTNKFKERLSSLQNNLKLHRQNNFMGQVLQHQTLRSTKYFSKWIEEKTKNSN